MRRIALGNFKFWVEVKVCGTKYNRMKIEGNKVIIKIPSGEKEKNIKNIVFEKLKRLGLEEINKEFLTSFLFFGKTYRVIRNESFFINHKDKILFFNNGSARRLMKYLIKSLRNYAKNYLRKVYKKFGLKNIPEVKIKLIGNKLGCLENGTIVLNLNLCFFPKYLVKYVIDHELIHYKVNSHNHVFNHLISLIYPNYKEIEKELKKFVIIIGYNKTLQKLLKLFSHISNNSNL